MVDFPSPTSPDPGDGSIGQNSYFFQNNINTNQQQRHLYRDNVHALIQDFLSGGGGGGVQAHQLILQFTEGVQWLYYTFFRGGGSNFFQGEGGGVQLRISIETHMTITCDFPGGGSGTHIPLWIRTFGMARIGSDEPARPPFRLRNIRC